MIEKILDIKYNSTDISRVFWGESMIWERNYPPQLTPFSYTINDNIRSILVDDEGNVYVGSFNTHVIKFASQGTKLWDIDLEPGKYSMVDDIKMDKSGNLLVAWHHHIFKLSPAGKKISKLNGFDYLVSCIAIDSQENIYAAQHTSKVMKFSSSGTKLWEKSLGDNYNTKIIINIDKNDNIYISALNVQKITPEGEKIWEYTEPGFYIRYISLDKNGNIYCGANDNQQTNYDLKKPAKIIKLSPEGKKIWEFEGPTVTIDGLTTDIYGNTYANFSKKYITTSMVKVSPHGFKKWEFEIYKPEGKYTKTLNCIKLDNKGDIYTGGEDKKVTRITQK